jgi:DNA anti-recombination protein RmuC
VADLEQAGTELLELMKNLTPEFDRAEKAFDEAEKDINDAVESLDKKYQELEDKVEEFRKQVAEDRKDNEEQHHSSHQSVDELKKQVLDHTQQSRQKMDETHHEMEEFGEQGVKATEPKVESIFQIVAEAVQAFEQKANDIEGELSNIFTTAANFFENEVVQSLEQNQRDQDDRHNTLADWIHQEAMPSMAEKHTNFRDKLDHHTQQTGDKMHETGDHAHTESKSALDQCLGDHMETINQILGLGQSLSSALSNLSGGVDAAGGTVDTVKTTMETGVDVTNVSTKAIIGCIEKFMDFAKKFSFL